MVSYESKSLKLVVVSHPCSNPQNQIFFQRLLEVSGWEISIIAPETWRTLYDIRSITKKHEAFQGTLKKITAFLRGNIALHFYSLRLLSELRRQRPDWIYVQNEPYALSTIEVMLLNRLFIGAKIAFYSAQNINKKYPWPFRAIEKWNFESADLAFAVTESAAECLRQKGYSKKLTVLPLGVDESYLYDGDSDPEGLDTPVVGYVGRLVPEKGVDDLLRALARLVDLPWNCQIAGDGPDRGKLIELAEQLKIFERVTFAGYVPHGEMKSHVKSLSVLILPSRTWPNWKEQFGRVIIEALAAGVPVIGSDSGEIPFLIRHLQGGIVIKEGDITELAAAIAGLIGNKEERRRLGNLGRENVKRYYMESEIAKQFVTALEA
jgi:glycosyltransferase involved in cell wall biosynthesis